MCRGGGNNLTKRGKNLQSSSSEAVWKLVYFQPSVGLICNVQGLNGLTAVIRVQCYNLKTHFLLNLVQCSRCVWIVCCCAGCGCVLTAGIAPLLPSSTAGTLLAGWLVALALTWVAWMLQFWFLRVLLSLKFSPKPWKNMRTLLRSWCWMGLR